MIEPRATSNHVCDGHYDVTINTNNKLAMIYEWRLKHNDKLTAPKPLLSFIY